MKKRNQIAQVAILTVAGVSALNVMAEEVETGNVSVTVQNAFTVTQTAPLSFGTIRATASGTAGETANLVVSADPNGTNTANDNLNASIGIIVEGTPAEWSVADVAPFGELTIAFPTTSQINPVGLPTGTPGFDLVGLNAFVTAGPNSGAAYNATNNLLQADLNGDLTFNVGGTLTSEVDTDEYGDGTYQGTYTVTLEYN